MSKPSSAPPGGTRLRSNYRFGVNVSLSRTGSCARAALIKKLFRQDPFIQAVAGVEQHGHFPAPVLGDIDAGDIADLEIVRGCADRAFLRLQNVEADLHPMREQGAPPAPRPERT